MDLKSLRSGARQFAHQLRKFYPEDESPVNHYVCEEHVVVLSTKKLYIYFYDRFIDYSGDYLTKTTCEIIGENHCKFDIRDRIFDVRFESSKALESFIKFYNKYK